MEMPETAARLLNALVEIESQAVEAARMGGCKCSAEVEGMDRAYPYARFDRATAVGKLFNEIPWEIVHQPGCPMDGQKGVGYAGSS
jgi:hypothetical protein